jgi:hypothetical protein
MNSPKRQVEFLVTRMMETGLISSERQMLGCSEQQVAELERHYGHRFPAVYREFLLAIGVAAGNFLIGTDFLYPELLDLRDAAKNLLRSDGSEFQLADDAWVFEMHQGYVFFYFDLGGDPVDPRVFSYAEGIMLPKFHFQHFSTCILETITDLTNPRFFDAANPL